MLDTGYVFQQTSADSRDKSLASGQEEAIGGRILGIDTFRLVEEDGRLRLMWRDPIVDEIRQYRRSYAAQFHYKLKAICQDLRAKQKKSGRTIVSFPPKRLPRKSAEDHAAVPHP